VMAFANLALEWIRWVICGLPGLGCETRCVGSIVAGRIASMLVSFLHELPGLSPCVG